MKEQKIKIITVIGICLILVATICGTFWARAQGKKQSVSKTTEHKEQKETTTETVKKEKKKTQKKATTRSSERTTTEKVKKEKKDKYQTDPTPQGKPKPVEPEQTKVDPSKEYTCTVKIVCHTVLNHMDDLREGKETIIPKDGIILQSTKVTFSKGQNAYDVLLKVTKERKIHFESSNVPGYNSRYIEGIGNLYEKDCGELSGWMYQVNGWFPNYGCSRYEVKQGDTILWQYTCNLGDDIGGNNG